jgi:hypothetical protein
MPKFAPLAAQQPLAEDPGADLEGAVLDEEVVLAAEDFIDLVGMVEYVKGEGTQAEADGIALFAGAAGHESEGVPLVFGEATQQEVPPGAGWDFQPGHHFDPPTSP